MKASRPRKVFLAAATVALALLVWFAWRSTQRHALAALSVPVRPTLPAAATELADELNSGEKEARSYLHSVAGLGLLSRLYHANGFYNEAMQCYAGLQQLQPTEARWPHLAASILADFGRLEEAIPLSERAVALAPRYIPARLRLGDIMLKANRTAAAAKIYAEVTQQDANNPYAILGLAKCDLAQGDWNAARERLRQSAKLHPEFIGGLSLLVTVSEHFNDHAEAAALNASIGKKEFVDFRDPWAETLFDDCYDPYRLSVAASIANFSGDVSTARRWLERAIALAPNTGSYCRQLGDILLQAGDFSAARKYLEKAIALSPSEPDAWIFLATLFSAAGDSTAATRTLINGLANCPQSAALHYAYGQKLSAAGQDQAAMAEFKAAKKLRPNEANAYIDLAMIYFRVERVEEAVAELRGALAVQPGHPLAMEVLARYAIDTNDEPAARHWIAQLRQQPRVPAADLQTIVAQYQNHFGRAP
jgi:tetratricopeptide (TPR) repeat protein